MILAFPGFVKIKNNGSTNAKSKQHGSQRSHLTVAEGDTRRCDRDGDAWPWARAQWPHSVHSKAQGKAKAVGRVGGFSAISSTVVARLNLPSAATL